MYHPSRGGVRGGRDQFNWDDVKADKHRENYLGHSVKAPVGRWQRGKDLHWYTKGGGLSDEAERAELERIKAEEEQAMREALGLAPVRENRNQGNRLDKHELQELLKRGKTSEELSETYTTAERVQGLGFGPVAAHKKLYGYEQGDQLAGIQPEKIPNSDAATTKNEEPKDDVDVAKKSKEERREAREKRRQEKKAAKLARKEERKHKERSDEKKDKHSRSFGQEDDSPTRKRHRRRHDSDSD